MIKNITLLLLLICSSFLTLCAQDFQLSLVFENISPHKGQLLIGVYDNEEDYDGEKEIIMSKKVEVSDSNASCKLTLPKGEYSIAVLHDTNGNQEMDTNFIGIPKEGYGFSQNPSAKMRKPSYGETAFKMSANRSMKIKMVNW